MMKTLRYVCAALVLVAGCDAMKNSPRPLAATATLDLYVVSPANTPNCKQVADPDTNAPLFLVTPPIISAADVATIQRTEDSPQQPTLTVTLTQSGGAKLAAATANPAGMRIAVVVQGTVVTAPEVRSPLSTSFSISDGKIAKQRDQLFQKLTGN